MKNIILIALVATALCSCVQPPAEDPGMRQRQVAFFQDLKEYSLPENSIPSELPSTTPSFRLYLAAEKIAEQQGLISDASMAPEGKLVVGKVMDGDSVIIGVQFIIFDDESIGFENITKCNGLHVGDVQKMEKKFIKALTKELYENFS
jgi:hypothetical protein